MDPVRPGGVRSAGRPGPGRGAVWPLAMALCLAAATLPRAQEEAAARFSSGVQAVEVYTTVTDGAGEPVTGLRADDFELDDDRRPQTITTFAEGAFPLTVALGVDRSLSMAGEPLRLARRAAQSFLEQLRPDDRSMVVAISAEADVVAPLTASRAEQARAIAFLDPWSTTALRDAVVKTLDRLAPEPGRQALVVFSDGTDRYSQVSASEMLNRARGGPALVYPIVFGRAAGGRAVRHGVAHGRPFFRLARRPRARSHARQHRPGAPAPISPRVRAGRSHRARPVASHSCSRPRSGGAGVAGAGPRRLSGPLGSPGGVG